MKNTVLFSTTSSLDGYKILEYIGPVSSHVVIGTNFFSDFFAAFSDIFGGRSGTYQKKIRDIYEEATEECRKIAFLKGANAVIGFQIDMDEISGGGKQMFMVSAVGTAVFAEKVSLQRESNNPKRLINHIDLEAHEEKMRLIEKYGNKEMIWRPESWSFIKEHRFTEFLELQYPFLHNDPNEKSTFHSHYTEYITSLPIDIQKSFLYEKLLIEENKNKIRYIQDLMSQNKLFDFEEVVKILKNDSLEISKKVLPICISSTMNYSKEDIDKYLDLCTLLKEKFPVTHKIVLSKSNILSSKEVEMWQCQCGQKRKLSEEYCQKVGCGENSYGFKEYETKPHKVISFLENRARVMQSLFH